MSDTVLLERDGNVAVVTLNRPESLNALNVELMGRLAEVLEEVAGDDAIRAVLLTGAGRGFCAGGDLKNSGVRSAQTAAEFEQRAERGPRFVRSAELLFEMAKPVVAAVNGAAAGAGLAIALAADYRLASDRAKFTTAFAKVGYSGDYGATWLLQRILGAAKARELLFFPEVFDGEEAQRLGLVNRVVPHDTLMTEARALAERLAAGPTIAYALIKENLAFGATHTLTETLDREVYNMGRCRMSEQHQQAKQAWLERRTPEHAGS